MLVGWMISTGEGNGYLQDRIPSPPADGAGGPQGQRLEAGWGKKGRRSWRRMGVQGRSRGGCCSRYCRPARPGLLPHFTLSSLALPPSLALNNKKRGRQLEQRCCVMLPSCRMNVCSRPSIGAAYLPRLSGLPVAPGGGMLLLLLLLLMVAVEDGRHSRFFLLFNGPWGGGTSSSQSRDQREPVRPSWLGCLRCCTFARNMPLVSGGIQGPRQERSKGPSRLSLLMFFSSSFLRSVVYKRACTTRPADWNELRRHHQAAAAAPATVRHMDGHPWIPSPALIAFFLFQPRGRRRPFIAMYPLMEPTQPAGLASALLLSPPILGTMGPGTLTGTPNWL